MLHDGLSPGLASKHRRVSRRDLSRASKWAGKQWALSPGEFLPSPTQAPFEAGSVKKPLSTSPVVSGANGNAGGTGETCVTACRPRATCHEGRASCRWPFIKGRRFGFPALPANEPRRLPFTSQPFDQLRRSRLRPLLQQGSPGKAVDPGNESDRFPLGSIGFHWISMTQRAHLARPWGLSLPPVHRPGLELPGARIEESSKWSIRPGKCERLRSEERGLSF